MKLAANVSEAMMGCVRGYDAKSTHWVKRNPTSGDCIISQLCHRLTVASTADTTTSMFSSWETGFELFRLQSSWFVISGDQS